MSEITGQNVWDAVVKEGKITRETLLLEALEPFIKASVDALKEHLDEFLTLKVSATCRAKFLRHSINNGFCEAMEKAIKLSSAEKIRAMSESLIESLEEIINNPEDFLDAFGKTEEEVMLGEVVNLNDENKDKWKRGELTVADVLISQPACILNNS